MQSNAESNCREQLYIIIFALLLRYFLSAIIEHLFNAIGIIDHTV